MACHINQKASHDAVQGLKSWVHLHSGSSPAAGHFCGELDISTGDSYTLGLHLQVLWVEWGRGTASRLICCTLQLPAASTAAAAT